MKPLPRYWKITIRRITGLQFCDRECDCGETPSYLWYKQTPSGSKEWLPGWMNGVTTEDVWKWLVENGRI